MMKTIKNKNKQKGVALVIGMILLLIISVIGITSMKSALLQEKMAAGLKNRELADAAALSLLVGVEKWLFDYYEISNAVILSPGGQYIMEPNSTDAIAFRTSRDFLGGYELSGANINSEYGGILANEPRFIIEGVDPLVVGSGSVEFDTASGGSSGGGGAADGGSVPGQLLIYKIIVKSTDTTGNLFSMFESVMSVKIR